MRWQTLNVFYKPEYSIGFSATCIRYIDEGKKNYTRFTSCNLMGSLGPCIILQGYVKSYKGCTLSKHLPLWWNVEGTIKDTDENCNPSTTCRNICVNSDKFCRSQFDLIHHWKTCNSIGEKQPCLWDINSILSIYVHAHIECMLKIRCHWGNFREIALAILMHSTFTMASYSICVLYQLSWEASLDDVCYDTFAGWIRFLEPIHLFSVIFLNTYL